MNRWIELKDGQHPRKGELIMVRDIESIYPHLLIAEGPLDWWVWDGPCQRFYQANKVYSGTKLSVRGFTHWTLLESPYLGTGTNVSLLNTDLNKGTWYQAAVSGAWYTGPGAAGDVAAVKVDGKTFAEDKKHQKNLSGEVLAVLMKKRQLDQSTELERMRAVAQHYASVMNLTLGLHHLLDMCKGNPVTLEVARSWYKQIKEQHALALGLELKWAEKEESHCAQCTGDPKGEYPHDECGACNRYPHQ